MDRVRGSGSWIGVPATYPAWRFVTRGAGIVPAVGTLRRAVAAVALVPVAGSVLLGGEVLLAQRGTHVAGPPPAPADATAGPPGLASQLVVWLGDSTAAGVGASGLAASLPRQVADRLGQPVRLTVLARSGARVADVVRSQLPALAHLAPDVVFISVGANDVTHLTWRSRFRRDYARVLRGLPATVRRVVVLGVPDLGSPTRLLQPLRAVAAWRGRALDDDVRSLARRHHAVYVDIAGHTGAAFRRDPHRYFAADHYHPDDAGYRLWAEAVVAAVGVGS
jgi:lysophospholipase L1-like esterase